MKALVWLTGRFGHIAYWPRVTMFRVSHVDDELFVATRSSRIQVQSDVLHEWRFGPLSYFAVSLSARAGCLHWIARTDDPENRALRHQLSIST